MFAHPRLLAQWTGSGLSSDALSMALVNGYPPAYLLLFVPNVTERRRPSSRSPPSPRSSLVKGAQESGEGYRRAGHAPCNLRIGKLRPPRATRIIVTTLRHRPPRRRAPRLASPHTLHGHAQRGDLPRHVHNTLQWPPLAPASSPGCYLTAQSPNPAILSFLCHALTPTRTLPPAFI